MKRVLDIVRIQLTNWPTMLAYPLGLLASLVVLGLVVDVSNGELAVDHQIFVLPSVYLVVGSAHLQTMTQVFPFAVGLGVTRRAFHAATAVVVAGYALLLGLALLGFQQIERATGGWGRHAQIFGLDYLRQDNPVAQWLVCTVPFLAVSTAAVFAGVVFQRWRLTGLYLLATGTATVLAGIGALVTWQRWWPAVGTFFTDRSTVTLAAGLPFLIALILGSAGWLVIRRATP